MSYVQKVVIGDAVLYQADCAELLPTLDKVDCVITDPPYGIGHSSNRGASWAGKNILGDSDTNARDAVVVWCKEIPFAMFGKWTIKPPPCRACLVWDKGIAGSGDLSIPWKPNWEQIYISGKGWRGHRGSGVISGPQMLTWESSGRSHPHEKPVWLLSELIKKAPDGVVLDPFMGSGTTGVAAIQLGRKFIGIEREPKYFDIACKRIKQAHAQGKLFEPERAKQVQEALV